MNSIFFYFISLICLILSSLGVNFIKFFKKSSFCLLFFKISFSCFSLLFPKSFVITIRFLEKFIMASLFHNNSMLKCNDDITVSYSWKSMSNHQWSWVFCYDVDCLLNLFFSFCIKCWSCLVEAHDFGWLKQSSCNSNSLLFTSRKFKSTLSD